MHQQGRCQWPRQFRRRAGPLQNERVETGKKPGLQDSSYGADCEQSYYASNILLVFALACAKASVVLLFIKVIGWKTMWKVDRYASQGVLAYTLLWFIASVIAVSLQCSPNRYALGPSDQDTCVDQYALQIGIRVTDGISDIAVAVLPALLMSKMQISGKSRALVIILFGTRLL